jgi:hypothetical protein
MKVKFLVTAMLVFSLNVTFAATQKLVSISNEEDAVITKLNLRVDSEGDITHMVLAMVKRDGTRVKDDIVYKAQTAADGIVLYEMDGYEVVRLKSDNFSAHQGGNIEIDILKSGLTGARNIVEFDVARDADDWNLYSRGKKVNGLHLKSNKILGKTVGIKSVVIK